MDTAGSLDEMILHLPWMKVEESFLGGFPSFFCGISQWLCGVFSSQCQVHSLTELFVIISCPVKAPVGINSPLLSAQLGLMDGNRTGGCVRVLLVIPKGAGKLWSEEM